MMLPCGDPRDPAGLEAGIREIADAAGMPLILYLKSEDGFGSDKERRARCGRPADATTASRSRSSTRSSATIRGTTRISTACCGASIARASSAAWASGRRSCTCATSACRASRPAPAASRSALCSALFAACRATGLDARRSDPQPVHAARGPARRVGTGARAAPRDRARRHRAGRAHSAVRLTARRDADRSSWRRSPARCASATA